MKVENLKIGDKIRYYSYFKGICMQFFGIIDSKMSRDYFRIKNLVTNREEGGIHKDSILAKIYRTGKNYKEIKFKDTPYYVGDNISL